MQYALYAKSKDKYDESDRQRKRQRTGRRSDGEGAGAASEDGGNRGGGEASAQEQQAEEPEAGASGAAASEGGLTQVERDTVFGAYTTCALQDEYSSTVSLESIEALCPNISRDKVLAALGELRDQNKCGPIDENNEIYKL